MGQRVSGLEKRYPELIRQMSGGIITLKRQNERFNICSVSERLLELLGRKEQDGFEYIQKEWNKQENREVLEQLYCFAKTNSQPDKPQEFLFKKDGSKISFEIEAVLMEEEVGESELILFLADRTEQTKLKECYEREQKRFEVMVSLSSDIIFEYDIEQDVMRNWLNQEGKNGYQEIMYQFSNVFPESGVIFPEDLPIFKRFLTDLKKGQQEISAEIRCKTQEEQFSWMRIKGQTIYDKKHMPIRVLGRITDISNQKQKEQTLVEQMNHDPLTRLYNQAAAKHMIEAALEENGSQKTGGLLLINLDEFSKINEKLGTMFGDEILLNVAKLIQSRLSSRDVAGRTRGDEFLLFFRDVSGLKEIKEKAEELRAAFSEIYTGENAKLSVKAAIGIAIAPTDGITYRILYEKAEKALCLAKSEGGNCCCFYEPAKEKEFRELYLGSARWRRRNEENQNEISKFDYEITDFAFQLMEETKDVDSAIYLLLRKVAEHYKLSNICIKEVCQNDSRRYATKYIYEYSEDGVLSRLNQTRQFDRTEWDKRMEYYKRNGFLQIEDAEQTEEPYRFWYRSFNIRAMVQCPFYNNGTYAGEIEFSDSKRARRWSREERKTFQRISRIISAYLLKLRAFEEATATVERLTGFDEITGLLKYERFLETAREQLMELYQTPEYRPVVIYSDISNFKYINETYGYAVGDRILREFAEHISARLPEMVCGSRVSSDNIVVLCKIPVKLTIDELLSEVLNARREFAAFQKETYADSNLVINTGIYVYDKNQEDIVTAVDNANLARKKAKQPKQPKCILFQEDMNQELKRQILFLKDIKNGLDSNEFAIYLQPKVDTRARKIIGAEALVRWVKPDGKIIYPNEFIPVFERNGSIIELDYYVYRKTFEYLRKQLDSNEPAVPVSMNVSRLHLEDAGIITYIEQLLREYQIPSELLEFEITENVFLDNLSFAGRMIDEMKRFGLSISIDDFGSGYSSLNIVKSLPIDILKLDKSLLDDYDVTKNGPIVIESIIRMAERMGIQVICEGVETKMQVKFLEEIGCHYVQGYYYSKPLAISNFNEMLQRGIER